MSEIKTASMIGFGPMGQLMAERMMPPTVEKLMYYDVADVDHQVEGVERVDLVPALGADLLAIAVPGIAMPTLGEEMDRHADEINPDALTWIECSVSQLPHWVYDRREYTAELMIVHSMVGPQSILDGGLVGRIQNLTNEVIGPKAEQMVDFLGPNGQGMDQRNMTAQEQDSKMVLSQAEAFLQTAANDDWIKRVKERNGDFDGISSAARPIMDGADWYNEHSPELIQTILGGNPEATEVVNRFWGMLSVDMQKRVMDLRAVVAQQKAIAEAVKVG